MSSWSDVIRGVALGDSWGRLYERASYDNIVASYGKCGPVKVLNDTLHITDDTQMTLYLAKALNGTATSSVGDVQSRVLDAWVDWFNDPENFRGPGQTCLTAISRLEHHPWRTATVQDSDGSGAVMRVWPAAFLPEDRWAGVAMWQAATTHGGHNAVAASLVAAYMARNGFPRGQALHTIEKLTEHLEWTKPLGEQAFWLHGLHGMETLREVSEFLFQGLQGLREAALTAEASTYWKAADPWEGDPSDANPGWRSHDTLVCAAVCLDKFPDDPFSAVRRAVTTEGDSDTIAAVTGALAACIHPFPWNGLDPSWFDNLEGLYRQWITDSDRYVFD